MAGTPNQLAAKGDVQALLDKLAEAQTLAAAVSASMESKGFPDVKINVDVILSAINSSIPVLQHDKNVITETIDA